VHPGPTGTEEMAAFEQCNQQRLCYGLCRAERLGACSQCDFRACVRMGTASLRRRRRTSPPAARVHLGSAVARFTG